MFQQIVTHTKNLFHFLFIFLLQRFAVRVRCNCWRKSSCKQHEHQIIMSLTTLEQVKFTLVNVVATSCPDCDTINGESGDVEVLIKRRKVGWAIAIAVFINGVLWHEEINPDAELKEEFNSLWADGKAYEDREREEARDAAAAHAPMFFMPKSK